MPDAAGAVGPILTALRALPVWVLGGLAVAGYAVLFLPAFGAITPVALDAFRANWGVCIWSRHRTPDHLGARSKQIKLDQANGRIFLPTTATAGRCSAKWASSCRQVRSHPLTSAGPLGDA